MRLIGILLLLLLESALWVGFARSPIPIPLAVPLVPTLVLVVAFAAAFLLRRWQARKAALEIERTLQKQGDAHAKLIRPDLRPEAAELRAEFSKAVAALKSSKLSRGGAEALSVLPWYLIVGPPGVGKTTALANSGLKFPYPGAGGGVRGVGGTRNCQWWLSNEAVILDTAGRYTTEDDDRDEWLSFLAMLAKTRPRRPINGLLVAVSAAHLAGLTGEAAAALGEQLRARVDEVMARLEMIVPVYVIFNKCDLLAGFVEMFGDLPKGERSQIWGFTESLGSEADPAELFTHRFDELAQVLEAKALQRLGQARRLEDRERIFQFPAQFEALREPATEFVRTLFGANVYQDTPLWRGAYFTSATQEGRPIDRVMQAMASAFGVERALAPGEERPLQTKSYFLQDMFSKVIFPDQALAVRSSRQSRRQRHLVYAYAASGFVAAALLMVFPTLAFTRNDQLIAQTHAVVRTQQPNPRAGLAGLVGLQQQVEKLVAEQARRRLSIGFGMDEAQTLLSSTGALYAEWARAELTRPAFDQATSALREFVHHQQGGTERLGREQLRYLDSLKLHLLLSRQAGEPLPDDAQAAWVARMIADAWVARTGHASERALAESQAALYVTLLARDPRLALPRDPELVRQSRDVLRRLDVAELALFQLLEETERACKGDALTLGDIVGGALPQMRSARTVRGSFTKSCFDDTVSARLQSGVQISDGWVLGSAAGVGDPATAAEQVSSLYFEQYLAEWRKFLESIDIQQPSNMGQLIELMDGLTAGDPAPLTRLFDAVAINTRIAATFTFPFAGGPASTHRFTAKEVQAAFDALVRFGDKPAGAAATAPPTSLDKYQQSLRSVLDALRTDAQSPQGGSKGGAMAVLQTATVQVEGLITSQALAWWQEPFLKQLLLAPLRVAARAQVGEIAKDLNQKWCNAVSLEFSKSLAGRYPFDPKGVDATVADVAAYFRPQEGTLWGFYQSNLQGDVQRMGGTFRAVSGTASQVYGPALLQHLSRAQDLTSALFPPNAKDISVAFAISIRPSADFDLMRFTVDGQTVDYRNGPVTWPQLKWPTEGNASGASLSVHSVRGESGAVTEGGEWGLFRLLEEGTLKSKDAAGFTVVWRFPKLTGSPEVAIDFRPTRSQTPFVGALRAGERTTSLLRLFRAPDVVPPVGVASGAVSCR